MKGSLTFVSNGRYTQMIIGEMDPAMKTPDTRRADAFSMAAVGTYTVNEADKHVMVRFERAHKLDTEWGGASLGRDIQRRYVDACCHHAAHEREGPSGEVFAPLRAEARQVASNT